MEITVKGAPAFPDQTFSIPDAYNDSALLARVKALEDKIAGMGSTPPPATTPATRRLFSPTAFCNTKLPANPRLEVNSAQMVAWLARAARTTSMGGTAVYLPGINVNSYTAPFFTISDASIPKTKVVVQDLGAVAPKTWTALHSQLQTEGFRLPAGLAGSDGTDGSGLIWDLVEDSILEYWQYRLEGGVHKISWGAVLKNVSSHPGWIQTLPSGEKQGSRASGIALGQGIVRISDLRKGVIPYALAFALPKTLRGAWVAPGTRTDGNQGAGNTDTDPNAAPMGQLFRLDPAYQIPAGTVPLIRMMLEAARDYGVYVVDTTGGSAITFQVEDLGFQAPDASVRDAWSWDQYKDFWAGKQSWQLLQEPAAGGQWPWSRMQAVNFPISS